MRATGLESSFHYTYRREVYASGQEVFMTQRVARPMKFAAFISIIISVAVIFAACQGAVGPKGDKGDDGDKGDKGDTTMGLPGFTPLQVKGDAPFVLINDVDNDDTNDELLNDPGEAVTIDLTDHFRGGTAPFKYGSPVVGGVASDGLVTIERVDDGPMYKFSVPADQATDGDGLSTWTVTITDDDGSTLDIEIKARRNDAPDGESAAVDATVGTQVPDMAPATPVACLTANANECASAAIDFTDDDDEEMLMFSAVSADPAKVEVVSWAAEEGVGNATNAVVVIRGLASTWVADTTPDDDAATVAGHIAVKVTVTATDRGGETAERTLEVEVDAAPTAAEALPSYAFTPTYTTDMITNLDEFFKDTEGEMFAPWLATGDDANVVVTSGGAFVSVMTDGTSLTITRKAAGGSAVITITATETDTAGPEQTVTGVINVTTS